MRKSRGFPGYLSIWLIKDSQGKRDFGNGFAEIKIWKFVGQSAKYVARFVAF